MKVGYFFIMPKGEQPPRIYPVYFLSSSIFNKSISLLFVRALAFFKDIEKSAGRQNTKSLLSLFFMTIVLNTLSVSSPMLSAACTASKCSSSQLYCLTSYSIERESSILMALVFTLLLFILIPLFFLLP